MTFEEWIKDKEFTQYVENGEFYALQKLCFEAGQKNCGCVHTDNSAVIERLQNEKKELETIIEATQRNSVIRFCENRKLQEQIE